MRKQNTREQFCACELKGDLLGANLFSARAHMAMSANPGFCPISFRTGIRLDDNGATRVVLRDLGNELCVPRERIGFFAVNSEIDERSPRHHTGLINPELFQLAIDLAHRHGSSSGELCRHARDCFATRPQQSSKDPRDEPLPRYPSASLRSAPADRLFLTVFANSFHRELTIDRLLPAPTNRLDRM
jgi:hypothetical protein